MGLHLHSALECMDYTFKDRITTDSHVRGQNLVFENDLSAAGNIHLANAKVKGELKSSQGVVNIKDGSTVSKVQAQAVIINSSVVEGSIESKGNISLISSIVENVKTEKGNLKLTGSTVRSEAYINGQVRRCENSFFKFLSCFNDYLLIEKSEISTLIIKAAPSISKVALKLKELVDRGMVTLKPNHITFGKAVEGQGCAISIAGPLTVNSYEGFGAEARMEEGYITIKAGKFRIDAESVDEISKAIEDVLAIKIPDEPQKVFLRNGTKVEKISFEKSGGLVIYDESSKIGKINSGISLSLSGYNKRKREEYDSM